MMRGTKTIAAVILATMLMVPAAVASASRVADCEAQIAALQDQTTSANFLGRQAAKDEAGLVAKLSEADAKLDQGKLADAQLKLEDYRSRVETLAASGKLDATDAAALMEGADAAIACVQTIGA
jgi:Tfp pilus assembly protein PilF